MRSSLEVGIPMLGAAIILGAVIFMPPGAVQLVTTLVGIAVMIVSGLRLNQPLLPNERRFLALRMEVDDFIQSVRRVNAAAIRARQTDSPDDRRTFERGCDELIARAEHIGLLAGRTHGTIDPPAAREPAIAMAARELPMA